MNFGECKCAFKITTHTETAVLSPHFMSGYKHLWDMAECACDFPRRKSVRSHKGDTGKPNLSEAGGIDSKSNTLGI